jgi:hypothetical protein
MSRLFHLVALGSMLLSSWGAVSPAEAHPGTSPSARAAARLKYNPPRGWIRHYLGDDRYKILGGSWKVVSTELDSYYYPPWAAEMLRQPAGIVIGFPSAAAAEEAGYRRSNYPMEEPTLNALPGAPGGLNTVTTGGMSITTNRGRATRITLSDGASSTILPAGWTHMKMARDLGGAAGGMNIQFDMLTPGAFDPRTETSAAAAQNKRLIAFMFISTPGRSAEAMLDPQRLSQMTTMMSQNGQISNSRSNATSALSQRRSVRYAGLKGIQVTMPVREGNRTINVPLTMVGRGSKIYGVINFARGAAGANTIVNSFQPR